MFDRAPTFHVGAHICGLRIICVRRRCFLDLKYFMSADIFQQTPTFLGRRHFAQGADILPRAPTFETPTFYIGRQHFDVNYYFEYCRQKPTFCQFLIFAVSSASCFAISFCLIFYCLYLYVFQYLFMHVVCANIFGAIVLKPRFKIDTVIMIICSIVIIINFVLTLHVQTAKPMIADLVE